MEGTRSAWHYHLIALTGEKAFYRDKVLAALEEGATDADHLEDTTSLFHLAAQFASRDDDQEAGDAVIRKCLQSCPEVTDHDLWGHLIVYLEGLHGLGRVLNRWGKKLDQLCRCWLPEPLEWAEEDYAPKEVEEYLDSESQTNESIRLYWEAVKAVRSEGKKTPSRPASAFQELLDRFLAVYPETIPWTDETLSDFCRKNKAFQDICWSARKLHDTEDYAAAFEMLSQESDPCRQYFLLSYFQWPRDTLLKATPQLLALLDPPFSKIRSRAASAFSYLTDPLVRAKGLEILADAAGRSDWPNSLYLLEKNFAAEDYPLLDEALNLPMDSQAKHDVALRMGHLLEPLPPDQCLRLLLWKYESSPCSECRYHCVSELVERNLAPQWLLEECLDDCDHNTRELARKTLNLTDKEDEYA